MIWYIELMRLGTGRCSFSLSLSTTTRHLSSELQLGVRRDDLLAALDAVQRVVEWGGSVVLCEWDGRGGTRRGGVVVDFERAGGPHGFVVVFREFEFRMDGWMGS
jgi:hypothetical protein